MWFEFRILNLQTHFRPFSSFYTATLAGLLACAMAGLASGQLVATYSTNLDEVLLPDGSVEREPSDLLMFGYELDLPAGLSLTPSLGVVVDSSSIDTLVTPNGYALGVWGHYDFATFGDTTTYALGGLSFVDFGSELGSTAIDRTELQYGFGLGAALPISNSIDAFTNVRYLLVDGSVADGSYDGATTGLEIGIEISF